MKHIPKPIPGFERSYALLSDQHEVSTAVVFVHGFGGSPTATWRNFQTLVYEYSPDYPWWADSDMFFYSYDSRTVPIGFNAVRLAAFLHDILSPSNLREIKPADFLPQAGQSLESYTWGTSKYQNLILAGHSEGAVVIRRLILDRFYAIRKAAAESADKRSGNIAQALKKAAKKDLILRASLRLFAPACLGTNFSSLLGFAVRFSSFIAAIAASSLVRNELLAGSPILNQLQTETEKACVDFPLIRAFAAKALLAERDHIVYSGSYNCDELRGQKHHNHFSICKPDYLYKLPLEFVAP